MSHFTLNNFFSKEQYGFMRKRSCETQLLSIMEHWSRIIDDGTNIDVIYLDFQKAFDKVPHQRLLSKLIAYGIQDKVFDWIENYLSSRKQRVAVCGSYSNWTDVISIVLACQITYRASWDCLPMIPRYIVLLLHLLISIYYSRI